jgi:hypothetical protein
MNTRVCGCRLVSTLLLLTVFRALPCVAQEAGVLFDAKAEETIRVRVVGEGSDDRRTVVEQQKVAFHHISLWGDQDGAADQQVIAKETLRQVLDDQREGVESKLRVDLFFAKENMGRFPSKPTHTLEIPDTHEAHFEDTYWTATTLGCCDAEPYSRMYKYGADHPFLRYNENFWKVEVPNARGLDRYVGMAIRGHVPNESAADAIFGKQRRAVAAVSLAAPGKPLSTVYLVATEGVDPERLGLHTEKLQLTGTGAKDEQHPDVRLVTLWSLDGAENSNAATQAISNVTVEAGVYVDDGTTETLRAEIKDDKFVNAKVTGNRLKALVEPVSTK